MTVAALKPGSSPPSSAMCRPPSSGVAPSAGMANSLLFSLEVEDSPLTTAAHKVHLQAQLELLATTLQPLLSPKGPFHAKLWRDVRLFRDIMLAEEGEVDGVVLASKLTMAGYRVAVRQALGGGSGVAVFSNLRHTFLLVTAQDCPCAGVDFIVEPHFREQFEISCPTPRYSGLLEMLPRVMVGTAAHLTPLVQLLCSEMSLAFEQHGLSLPPWRQSKSLLSKWLPSKARDYDLSPYASPRAASPEPLFPLSCVIGGASPRVQQRCASEGPSGSLTPAFSTGEEDTSPRAVLRGASAMLLSQQAAAAGMSPGGGGTGEQQGAAAPGGGTGLRPKSLLSSSLAATKPRCTAVEQKRPGSGSENSAAASARQQPLHPAASIHHGSTGLAYRVSSEWQQPAIRTVKMQGQAVPPSQQK